MSQQMLPAPPTTYNQKYHLIAQNGHVKWELINPPKKKHLFVLAGQSNCQSANKGPITSEDTPDPRIFMMSQGSTWAKPNYEVATKGVWQVAQHPLQHLFLAYSNSVGFGLNFAKEYLKSLGPDDEVYILCNAYGGSGFTPVNFGKGPISWRKGFQGYMGLYERLLEDTHSALASVQGLELKGFLWHQGETDVGNPNYQAELYKLINDYRTDVGNPNLPVVCGTMLKTFKDAGGNGAALVDAAHKGISNMVWLADCAVLDDLTGEPDNVHFNAASQRIMGKRYLERYVIIVDKYQKALEEWKTSHPN